MKNKGKVRLSSAQVKVLGKIAEKGRYWVGNNDNPTVKKLLETGVCQYENGGRDYLVFTETGRAYEETEWRKENWDKSVINTKE